MEDRRSLPVAGMDEAGRGPWAGPVVAAAVILDRRDVPGGLDDSKKLTAARRSDLFDALRATAWVGVGIAEVSEIDRLNILHANDLAMRRAVEELAATFQDRATPFTLLIDGNRVPEGLAIPAESVVRGDSLSLSIAAASIIAKVTRDRIMTGLDEIYPGYGWARNKGYGTAEHRNALWRLGLTPEHRQSFKPVANVKV